MRKTSLINFKRFIAITLLGVISGNIIASTKGKEPQPLKSLTQEQITALEELYEQKLWTEDAKWEFVGKAMDPEMVGKYGVGIALYSTATLASILAFRCLNKSTKKSNLIKGSLFAATGVTLACLSIRSFKNGYSANRKYFEKFVKNWNDNKEYTPKDLHPIFDDIYEEYSKSENPEEYLNNMADDATKKVKEIAAELKSQKNPDSLSWSKLIAGSMIGSVIMIVARHAIKEIVAFFED